MQKSSFNFATVFSLMVLFVFAYIAYLGMVYWQQGNQILPIALSLLLIVLVALCVFVMCKSKATRWRNVGRVGQWTFGFLVLVAFVAGSVPFTNFLRVLSDSDHIKTMVNTTCDKAIGIDADYEAYVDKRIADYRSSLSRIASGKANRPSVYQLCMGTAPGATDEQRINNLAKSLRSRLLPDSAANVIKERHQWLERAKNENVMNPLTPANVNKVSSCVDNWVVNYRELSKVSYQGEENVPEFQVSEFDNSLRQLIQTYSTLQAPSIVALLIALVCFVIMLFPYWITEGDLAAASSTPNFSHRRGKRGVDQSDGNLFDKNGF